MLFITVPLMALSMASSAGYDARASGLVGPDTVIQSLQSLVPQLDIWMLVTLILAFSLIVKVLVDLASSIGTRPVTPSRYITCWPLVSVLLLSVFAVAFVFFPSDFFHDLARQLPAAAPLWSFIKHGVIEPAPIRYCFDNLGNLDRLLDPAKEARYLRCFDESALFESPEITAPVYLTCDYDTVYARLSCLSRSVVHTLFEFGSRLRFSWIQVLTFDVLICWIVIVYKLYSSTLELKATLKKSEEESCMAAEYSRQERAFYRKRDSTLRTTNAGLIIALDSALPKITAADLRCAQARAHANQLEVAIDDLKDAHAVEVRTLKTAVTAAEAKATKASAHARSLMKTAKTQRFTVSSLRVSANHLVRKCSAQDDVIATLASEKERLETMVNHIRIGIAKLASVSQELSVDESLPDDAEEESEAVPGPCLDYDDFLNFASFQDSMCDLLDEEEDQECSNTAIKPGSSPSSTDNESAPHTPVTDLGEEAAQIADAQIVKLCGEMYDLKLTDSFLIEALADVLSPYDCSPVPALSSDDSFWKMFDCLSEEAPLSYFPLTTSITIEEVAPQSPVLVASPSTSEYPSASSAPVGSSPSFSKPQTQHVCESTPETSASALSSTSATDSCFAPFGSSPTAPGALRTEHLFEGMFGDISLDFAYPPQNLVSSTEPLSLFTPVRRPPSPSSTLTSDRQWLMFSPSCAVVMPGTPDFAYKAKVKASTTSARTPFANKENVMPL